MLIMTTSPSTSAASTDGLRERIVASVMAEVGSVLDSVGIAVAPVGEMANLFPASGAVEPDPQQLRCLPDSRIRGRPRNAVLLTRAAGCYGLRQLRPRRWQGMTAETRIAATGLDHLAEEPHARVPHLV